MSCSGRARRRNPPGFQQRAVSDRTSTITVGRSRIQQSVELADRDARHAQKREEPPSLPPFVGDVGSEQRGDDQQGDAANRRMSRQQPIYLRPEKQSRRDINADPHDRAHPAEESELREAHARSAGEGRRDQRQPGYELGGDQRVAPQRSKRVWVWLTQESGVREIRHNSFITRLP